MNLMESIANTEVRGDSGSSAIEYSYSYYKENFIFTDDGNRTFTVVRDVVRRILSTVGAIRVYELYNILTRTTTIWIVI